MTTSPKEPVEISDTEADGSGKEDPNDADYEQQTQRSNSATTPSKAQQSRRADLEKMSKEALVRKLVFEMDLHKDTRKKRTQERKERDKASKERTQLRKENKRLDAEVEILNQNCRDLRRENLEEQETFRVTLEATKEQFADAQEDWIAKIDESVYPSLPDNILRDQFQKLFVRCKDWVREWYLDYISPQSQKFFERVIARCAPDHVESVTRILLNAPDSKRKALLKTLGQAWLSREMIRDFFESPFFAAEKSRRSLEQFYNTKLKDPKKAYSWRAETLRLIRDDLGLRSTEIRSGTTQWSTLIRLCAPTMNRLLHGPQAVVLQGGTPEVATRRDKELTEICYGFCLLAFELWCQKAEVNVVNDAFLFQQPFSMTSAILQPHMSMGVDEDDHRFDNVLPHAVLIPAVRVFGDPNGSNLDQGKILSRATVLVFENLSLDVDNNAKFGAAGDQPQSSGGQTQFSRTSARPESKKRKRPSAEAPVTPSSKGERANTLLKSTTLSPKVVLPSREAGSANQTQSVLTGVLEQIERGITYDRLKEQLQLAAEDQKTSPETTVSSQTLISSINKPQQAGLNENQLKDTTEDEKPSEKFQGGQSATVLLPQRREASSIISSVVDEQVSNQASEAARQQEVPHDTVYLAVANQGINVELDD